MRHFYRIGTVRQNGRTEGTAHTVKCLLYKHEDLDLIPRTKVEKKNYWLRKGMPVALGRYNEEVAGVAGQPV